MLKEVRRVIKTIQKEGIVVFLKRVLTYVSHFFLYFFIYPYALLKVKSLDQKLGLEELLNIAFNSFGGLIKPDQIRGEILELLTILEEVNPNVILEIGTARGGTLFLFSRIASEDATIFSIDIGLYSKFKHSLYKAFVLPKQKIHLIRKNSHSQETLKNLISLLGDRKLDFLFINGDHTYEGVKMDFKMYGKLVRKGE